MLGSCWPYLTRGPYIQLNSSDDSDSEEELELTEISASSNGDHTVVTVSNSSEDEIDGRGISYSNAAYRGVISNKEAASLTSIGYALLRICDYVQLYLLGKRKPQASLIRERRNLESKVPTALYDVNRTNHTVPQWVYPCGITPNATFPSGQQIFSKLNTTSGQYELLTSMNYSDYFRGGFDELAHRYDSWGRSLLIAHDSDQYLAFPYGITGRGDMILRHFGNFTPQYPYASYGISNSSFYNGTSIDCPRWIFNATQFFGGGYLGLEEPGFEPIYPCGIHPDGRFTGQWLGFPNNTIPSDAYPFGYFPNRTFPYLDYFFNPDFNHTALYWAAQRNETSALQNFTSFLDSNVTRLTYHHIPTNYTDPFASCYGIYPPRSYFAVSNDTKPHLPSVGNANHSYAQHHSYHSHYPLSSQEMDRNLIQAGLWGAQLGAEFGVFLAQNIIDDPYRCRIMHALYLGARSANIIHSAIDLITNTSHIMQYGPTNGEGERALRNMLTLTDVLNLTNEAIYFCTPAIQRIQDRIVTGSAATYFTGLCSSLRGAGNVVRGALSRLTAITGAVGVACTAVMGAALTTQLLDDEQDVPEQSIILSMQLAVTAVASAALAFIARANTARAEQEIV